MTALIATMIVKLSLFVLLYSGAGSFCRIGTYVYIIWASFVLSVPEGLFRKKWIQISVMAIVDVITMSLVTPFCFRSILLPSTTLFAVAACLGSKDVTDVPKAGKIQYCGYICAWTVLSAAVFFLS